MATTTPNYGWAVPTSTDLVKDGATAIETLGDAIDASMNTALGTKKSGMVLLNTTSFSAVASVSLPADTFTATYDNYLMIVKVSAATADGTCYMKMRASGTDSSANYYWSTYGATSGASVITLGGSNLTTGFVVLDVDAGSSAKPTFSQITLFNPKKAEPTSAVLQTSASNTVGTPIGFNLGALHTPSTAYDSATLIASAGNITGSIIVYGWNI